MELPLKFLEVALPSQGHYCLVELSTKKKEKFMQPTVAALESKYVEFNERGLDVFVSMASFQDGESRVAQNTLFMRSFFIDLDCNHPKDIPHWYANESKERVFGIKEKAYASAKAALAALQQFLEESGLGALGAPWLNNSGGGVHAYWPLAADVPVREWKVDAENLKRLCLQLGLKIDMGVTADSARVLRVPGTVNTGVKNDEAVRGATKVKQVTEGGIFSLEAFRAVLLKKLNGATVPAVAPTLMLEGPRPDFADAEGKQVLNTEDSRENSFKLLLEKTQRGEGCLQLGWYLEKGHMDDMESKWYGWLGVAKKCVDGDKAIKLLTKVHGYTDARLQTKLKALEKAAKQSKNGESPFYLCTKFDIENPGVCNSCKHFGKTYPTTGKGWSPITLCGMPKLDNKPKTINPEVGGRKAKALLTRPDPPHGYSYGAAGGIFVTEEEEDKWGVKHTKTMQVLPYEMFPAYIVKEREEHIVLFALRRPDGMRFIRMPQKSCVSKDECLRHLAAQNVVCSSFAGAKGDWNLYGYIRGCVAKLSQERGPVVAPDNFGWQDDGTFVLGELRYQKNEEPAYIPMSSMENILRSTKVEGTLEGWKAVVEMMIRNEQWGPLAFLTVGFGSPLMKLSGCSGMTFHAGGRFSGTGKTTGLELCSSIWGHPRDYRVGSGTSDVALIQRAGLLRSLPLVSDEITHKQRNAPEWIPGFLLGYSDGKGKERLESGANKERLNLTTWESLSALSSNTYILDYLSGSRAHSSHGEIYRILEWIPTESDMMHLSGDDIEILKTLKFNYGWAGEILAQWLVDNWDTAKVVYKQVEARIKEAMQYKDGERFWLGGITACITGAILCGAKYANIIDLPVQQILDFFKKLVSKGRQAERSGHRTAEDILNEYTREYYGQMIIIRDYVITIGEDKLMDASSTRTKVMGRIEHSVEQGFSDYYIAEKEMKAFCTSRSFGYAEFKKQIGNSHRMSVAKKNLLQGVAGPEMRVTALKISRREVGNDLEEV